MNKNWKFKKGNNNIIVTLDDNANLAVTINDSTKVGGWVHTKEPLLEFSREMQLVRDGKKFWCKGFRIEPEMHKEIKEEIEKLKAEAERQHQLEYDAYLSGKKKIELKKDEADDFCFVVDYIIKDNVAQEVLRDLGCLDGGIECGCIERLTSELKDEIKEDNTIDIKDCIALNRKREEEKEKKKAAEMLKPAIQSFTFEDKKGKTRIGDIIPRGYCKYIVDEIIEDIDYPELKTFVCHRKEEK